MRRAVPLCLAAWAAFPLFVNAATVSAAGATFKVRRDQPPLASRSVGMSAARNEFEAFQILVTGPATGVRAAATALSGNGTSIGPVRLHREDLIRIGTTSAPDAIVGAGAYLPDALVPDVDEIAGERRNAFVGFNVASGETRAIWGEVRVPASAPAGTYTGSVTVQFAEGSATVPVRLTVYDFTLPARASLKSAFGLSYGTLPAGHGISSAGTAFPALRARYDQLALDHRVSLSTHDDGDASMAHFDATYGPYVGGTAPTLTPGAALTSVQYLGGLVDTATLEAWYDHAAGQGWADRLLQYTCDEPPQTCAWTDIPGRLRAAKAANPAYRTLLTTTLGEVRDAEARYGISIQRDLELVVPVINMLDDKPGQRYAGPQAQTYAAFVASGPRKELWSYQSCMSHGCGGTSSYFTGWPSYMIDASAVRNRAMQWLEFLYGVTGEVYYETTMAYSHDAWSNQWDFSGNGDGTLFYPGTPARIGGTTQIPVASLRLKMIREGMEDYEYLKMLADLGDPGMARAEAQALFPAAYQTEQRPEALMAARDRIARRIVALRKGSPGPATAAPFTPAVALAGSADELGAAPIALSGAAAGVGWKRAGAGLVGRRLPLRHLGRSRRRHRGEPGRARRRGLERRLGRAPAGHLGRAPGQPRPESLSPAGERERRPHRRARQRRGLGPELVLGRHQRRHPGVGRIHGRAEASLGQPGHEPVRRPHPGARPGGERPGYGGRVAPPLRLGAALALRPAEPLGHPHPDRHHRRGHGPRPPRARARWSWTGTCPSSRRRRWCRSPPPRPRRAPTTRRRPSSSTTTPTSTSASG